MKNYRFIKDYLSFNRSENRGIIILLLILILVSMANSMWPENQAVTDLDFPGLEKELKEFEAGMKQAEVRDSAARLRRAGGSWRSGDPGRETRNFSPVFSKPLLKVDINRADTLELQQLKGIGPSFARRIVAYRNKLGGYLECKQLLEVWGFDTSLYNLISENVFLTKDSLRLIDINTVTFKEMLKHPYFPYGLTRAVILYRQKHKMFRTVDELKSVEGVTDSVFRRIRPYVKINSEVAR